MARILRGTHHMLVIVQEDRLMEIVVLHRLLLDLLLLIPSIQNGNFATSVLGLLIQKQNDGF